MLPSFLGFESDLASAATAVGAFAIALLYAARGGVVSTFAQGQHPASPQVKMFEKRPVEPTA